MRLCQNCGNPADDSAEFCSVCGNTLVTIESAQPAVDTASAAPSSDAPVPDATSPASPIPESDLKPTGPSRPIWETMSPAPEWVDENESLSSEAPVFTNRPVYQKEVSADASTASNSFVPEAIAPYIPVPKMPVPSENTGSLTPLPQIEVSDENAAIISRSTPMGLDHPAPADAPVPDVEPFLLGYSGALISGETGETLEPPEQTESFITSRPLPPIVSGDSVSAASPVLAAANLPDGNIAANRDPSGLETSLHPSFEPNADEPGVTRSATPIWARSAPDLSDVPEDLLFEDLEATIAEREAAARRTLGEIPIRPAKPVEPADAPSPDAWPDDLI